MINKTILLVEDNLDDVELTLRALKKSNIKKEVIVVTDGAEAVNHLGLYWLLLNERPSIIKGGQLL